MSSHDGPGDPARTGRGRRTQAERRAETRRGLVEAAIALWAEHPVADVSLDRLAAAAGCTRGAFHGNFEDRAEFVDTVLAAIVAEAGHRLAAAVAAAPDPLAGLTAYIVESVRFVADEPAKAGALAAIVRHREAAGDGGYADLARDGSVGLVALLRDGQRAGLVRDLDVELAAGAIRVTLDTQIRSGRVADAAAADRVGAELGAFFDAAVRR
ncbi:TetR family transcriptional regulator [Actinokineospora sp. PR83]|uniref:TetR/AcrR family transcriptional regulator n=1 Tax=Actinokineospora sp. PR83 TaxID=2884908 RepID=UPI001F396C26|nr:TetR/AcrR family transcriptional regulator [Actinokineospora sp. PR83]MCG8915233.1 TetR family transcriptional regulator [Actinokineospora sp. PR83]